MIARRGADRTLARAGALTLIGVVTVLLLASCGVLGRGSGVVVSQDRSVPDFDRVQLDGPGDVVVRTGDPVSLRVRTDDNIIDRLNSEVVDGSLVLSVDGWISSPSELTWLVTVPVLRGASVSGSGAVRIAESNGEAFAADISGSGLVSIAQADVDSFSADVSGSGRVESAGRCGGLAVTISGSGEFAGAGLECADGDVAVSGSGRATVNAAKELDARIEGSGTVLYRGDPQLTVDRSGSGSVERLEQ